VKYVVDTTDTSGRDKTASDLTESEAGAPEIIAPDPIESLAIRLRDKMEHLDPSETGYLDWLALPARAREFYRICVLDLIGSVEAIDAIRSQSSHNRRIDGCSEECE
jgi:hypothetical protein